MPRLLRTWRQAICVVTLAVLAFSGARADVEADVRQIWQMLDYLAVDYRGAVNAGAVVSESEYREMQEFAADAGTRIATLPARDGQPALLTQANQLKESVAARADAAQVATIAHQLADQLLASYPVPAAPSVAPDLGRGATVYQNQCASCHGPTGHGDGALAAKLDPPPIAFTDITRARERSLFSLYQTISQGVQGTSMVSFATLPDADRWALAAYVGGLAYSPQVVAEGERLWHGDAKLRTRFPDLLSLSRATEASLASEIGNDHAAAVIAFLRSHPTALGADSLALARNRLHESVQAYLSGDPKAAGRLALSAYLDGFEPIEPQLTARDPQLLAKVETAMGTYRGLINRMAPPEELQEHAKTIEKLFNASAAALEHKSGDASAAFLGSYTILVREGLEALLIVVAIIAFLGKAERRDVLPYVHAGWIGALLAGLGTWAAATTLITISGANRELTEGYSSLFAALVLLSVGLWMHQKSVAGRWQRYVNERLSQTLNGRSAWLLGGLAFVAVYREVFETILFYVALWSEGNGAAILGGFGAGAVTLAIIAAVLLRSSARLPIGKFFSVSSIFIAVLAVVLAGKGVSALQEAGVLDVTVVTFPRVDLLGIYPSLQTLLSQLAVAVFAIVGFTYNARSGKGSVPREAAKRA
ncbi:MAG TPA: cytochrome c/FTR1 family iron permease [Steroidobacteraceae bacterium]|jgi:high-affinity iron transporter